MSINPVIDIQIELTPAGCLIRRGRAGKPTLSRILGVAKEGGNVTHLFLDRIVHRGAQEQFSGFRACGAISTVLIADAPIDTDAITRQMGEIACDWIHRLIPITEEVY